MTLTRRAFLASAAATSGCAPYTYRQARVCEPPRPDGPIRIDMHCHLMNVRDVSEADFVPRRFFNLEEDASPTLEAIAASLATFLAGFLSVGAWGIRQERGYLRVEMEKPLDLSAEGRNRPARQSNTDFCFFAGRTQAGVFRSDAQRQITGFFSTRIRNAARMMTLYPDMDLFLPSMVDLYEGANILPLPEHIAFYSELNLATRGRFLPLVSFTPEREYEDRTLGGRSPDDPARPSQMFWVKRAIDQLGFVGVKVHPSSGFSPIDNLRWGCLNTPRQRIRETDRELYDQFSAYDRYMEELYAFCKSRDVPILTHNSTGLSANEVCMQGAFPPGHGDRQAPPSGDYGDPALGEWTYAPRAASNPRRHRRWNRATDPRDEQDFTNNPGAWIAAMRAADRAAPGLPPLKVILGHLANGIDRNSHDGGTATLQPSPWLRTAVAAMRTQRHLYADLSEVNEFFESRALFEGYRDVLGRLISTEPGFARNLLYGSDWHMPATADAGARYPDRIEALLPARVRPAVMGETAADVFGLRPGQQTRARLARFYADPPTLTGVPRRTDASLPLSEVPWWDRM